jgi:hypothetical protein
MKKYSYVLHNLVGQQVVVSVSDPWEFCSQHGTGPFTTTVRAVRPDKLLLSFAGALTYRGVVFDRVVATARHADGRLDTITSHDGVAMNLTPVSSQSSSVDAHDGFERAAQWRGWHLIATSRKP